MGDFTNPYHGLGGLYKGYLEQALQQQQAQFANALGVGWTNTTITATWEDPIAQKAIQKIAQTPQAKVKSENERWLDRRVNEMRVVLG